LRDSRGAHVKTSTVGAIDEGMKAFALNFLSKAGALLIWTAIYGPALIAGGVISGRYFYNNHAMNFLSYFGSFFLIFFAAKKCSIEDSLIFKRVAVLASCEILVVLCLLKF
jgi:hypothetical protein